MAVDRRRRRHNDVIDMLGEPVRPVSHERERDDVPVRRPEDATSTGDTDAEIYERLAPELIRFATTLVGPSDAEDLLGAAVIRAITAPAWIRVQNKRAYLYRILVNEAHSTRRSRNRRHNRELRVYRRDDFEHELVDPALMTALRTLSVRQRAVIHLTYWADLTPTQVAATLDTSLRTVERDLTNARTQLEELLS